MLQGFEIKTSSGSPGRAAAKGIQERCSWGAAIGEDSDTAGDSSREGGSSREVTVELQLGSSNKEKTVILGQVAAAEIDTVALRLGSSNRERCSGATAGGQQQRRYSGAAAGATAGEKYKWRCRWISSREDAGRSEHSDSDE